MQNHSRIAFMDGSVMICEPFSKIDVSDPEFITIHCQDGSLVAVQKDKLKYIQGPDPAFCSMGGDN